MRRRSKTYYSIIHFMAAVVLMESLVLFFTLFGCSSAERAYHKYIMRGQIVDVSGKEVYLCIGSNDGAQVGQELSVSKLVGTTVPGHAKGIPTHVYKKELTGTVKITAIVNDHYAKAAIISGTADKNYVVELERKFE